jgi:hypothetical protein
MWDSYLIFEQDSVHTAILLACSLFPASTKNMANATLRRHESNRITIDCDVLNYSLNLVMLKFRYLVGKFYKIEQFHSQLSL